MNLLIIALRNRKEYNMGVTRSKMVMNYFDGIYY
jgi:hypothetical protein